MDDGRVLLARVIGEYVVSLRKDKNIRQERLAQLAGVEQRTLRRLERGQVDVSVFVLRQVVLALGEDMTCFWQKVERNLKIMGE